MNISGEAETFVEAAKTLVREQADRRRQARCSEVTHAVVRSTTGNIYDGIAFETANPSHNYCAECHAINELRYAEPDSPTLNAILVAEPAENPSSAPAETCDACLRLIDEFSDDGVLYSTSYVRDSEGWKMFPAVEQQRTADLL
jgi:cytidine deaminase